MVTTTTCSPARRIYRQSEALEREAVAAIPDGTYESDGFLDNDGLGSGPVPVKLRVDVAG